MKTILATASVTVMFTAWALAQCPKGTDSCVTIVKPTNGTEPGTTTTTIYNNDAHTQAVSNAVSAATATGLAYFLVTRPAMQAANNTKINQAEGQFEPVYEMLDSVVATDIPESAPAVSTMPAIKRHYLGETWQHFVNNSPYLEKRVASCAAETRPDPKKKVKKYEFNPCSNVWLMTDHPDADITLDCVALGLGAGRDMICQDFSGEVSFEAAKLVSLKIVITEDWATVYPDIVAKFGQPNGRDEKNTLGIWSTNRFHAAAAEIDQGTAIAWMTPEKYRSVAKAQRDIVAAEKQQNSLD